MSRENYMTPVETSAMNVGFKRKEKRGLSCPNCPNLSNHTIENCFKVHGFTGNGNKRLYEHGGRSGRGRGGRFNGGG